MKQDYNNMSEKIQLAAVNGDVSCIQFIENPTEELQLAAVSKNGYAIKYMNQRKLS